MSRLISNGIEKKRKLQNCLLNFNCEYFRIFREITGYLVMYRVYGLRTLENMFPNLAVIRGDELILHYAFMLFEMNELTEVFYI